MCGAQTPSSKQLSIQVNEATDAYEQRMGQALLAIIL